MLLGGVLVCWSRGLRACGVLAFGERRDSGDLWQIPRGGFQSGGMRGRQDGVFRWHGRAQLKSAINTVGFRLNSAPVSGCGISLPGAKLSHIGARKILRRN